MIISRSQREEYLTEISNGKEKTYADVGKDKGGSGDHFRPHDLLEAGYASCLTITTCMILDSLKLAYEEVTAEVTLERSAEKTTFRSHVTITGAIDEETKQLVLQIVANCPVKKTLSQPIEFR